MAIVSPEIATAQPNTSPGLRSASGGRTGGLTLFQMEHAKRVLHTTSRSLATQETPASWPPGLVQPARLQLALLDPQVACELGIVAAHLLDEAFGVLAADEHVGGFAR